MITVQSLRRAAVAAAAIALLAPAAQAQQIGPNFPGLNYSGTSCAANNALTFMGALQCVGAFRGNDVPNERADLEAAFVSAGWETLAGGPLNFLGKSDQGGNGPFTSNPSGSTGTLTFDTPITGYFVISLKGGNFFSAYLFNATTPTTSVRYTMAGLPNSPGLSHASLWAGPAQVVPEPSTHALMATGLAGLAGFARRRRNA